MTSLVELELSDNPLTSPPAQLCVRGMIHVFKYLDSIAFKDGKIENTNSLRRSISKQHSTPALHETQKVKKNIVDSGYSTSDGTFDPTQSQKWQSPATPIHIRTDIQLSKSDTSTPAGLSPGFCDHSTTLDDNQLKKQLERKNMTHSNPTLSNSNGFNGTFDISPEDNTPESQKSHEKEKTKVLGNVQTYREYKEALRQQRNQDSVYKTKDVSTPDENMEAQVFKSQASSPYNGTSQNSPISPYRNSNSSSMTINGYTSIAMQQTESKDRPIQKVTPSRNVSSASYQNGSPNGNLIEIGYAKPNSPIRTSGILQHNNIPTNKGALLNGDHKPLTATVGYVNNKSGQKPNK